MRHMGHIKETHSRAWMVKKERGERSIFSIVQREKCDILRPIMFCHHRDLWAKTMIILLEHAYEYFRPKKQIFVAAQD